MILLDISCAAVDCDRNWNKIIPASFFTGVAGQRRPSCQEYTVFSDTPNNLDSSYLSIGR
ncbi:MAG: hypothetical protein F6K17_18675 [Okeania sp. SIO3C4]|nr:hypothetical protein [Okeania sp. SIO3C4]